MGINKMEFDTAIDNVLKHPNKSEYREQAGRMLTQLATLITHESKIEFSQDHIQEVVLKTWMGLHKIKKEKGSAFNFLWTCMYRELIKECKKQQKYRSRNFLFSSLKYEPEPLDIRASEMEVEDEFMGIKKLDIDLDSFKEKVTPGEVTLPDGIGRPEKKKPVANNLVGVDGQPISRYVFKALLHLQENGQATLSELAELYGFHRGNRERTMEAGLREAIEANNLDIEISIKGKTITFTAHNLVLGE